MERLLLRWSRGFYTTAERTSQAIQCLGGFLCFDVGGSVDSWREWVNDPESRSVSSNYSGLEKHGDKITIQFEYDWFHETPGAPVFELTLEQMNYILDRWQEALEKKPNKIIITKDDNGEIKVEFED
jgi:hypothetical protein